MKRHPGGNTVEDGETRLIDHGDQINAGGFGQLGKARQDAGAPIAYDVGNDDAGTLANGNGVEGIGVEFNGAQLACTQCRSHDGKFGAAD